MRPNEYMQDTLPTPVAMQNIRTHLDQKVIDFLRVSARHLNLSFEQIDTVLTANKFNNLEYNVRREGKS
jgi:hypothetical protein